MSEAKIPVKIYAAESGFMGGKRGEQNLFTSFFVPVLMRIELGELLGETRRYESLPSNLSEQLKWRICHGANEHDGITWP